MITEKPSIPIVSGSHIPFTSFMKELKLLTAVMFHVQTILLHLEDGFNGFCDAP